MTSRTVRLEDLPTCCCNDCRMPAAFAVGIALARPSEPDRGPIEVGFAIYVCEHHRDNMPTTAAAFFPEENRQLLSQAMQAMSLPLPDFDAAAFKFHPLPQLAREGAN